MPKKHHKYYGKQNSPFYKLQSKARLARLLFSSVDKLKYLSTNCEVLYFDFTTAKSSGGFRSISAPRDDLKAVQKRIADLLQRIAPPNYLFAPVSGRSYVDNAAWHLGADSVRLLDIEDFFPKCTANKVIWFFRKQMGCSPDVAALLRGIVTRKQSLPQGSPCSPILAYLCYVDMWDEIERLVSDNACRLSVYADNLTISGEMVPGSLIWAIKKTLVRHGHRIKSDKERNKFRKPVEITGVILNGNHLLAPNRQHQKLYETRKKLKASRSTEDRKQLKAELTGREAQFRQIVRFVQDQ